MPQEIEVWYIIPCLRSEIAKNLISKGLPQKNIAKILGVTESAVSQYVKNKRASHLELESDIKSEIEKSSERLIKDSNIITEMQGICKKIRKTQFLCKVHKQYNKNISKDCRLCLD